MNSRTALDSLFLAQRPNSRVLDVGCFGFRQLERAQQLGLSFEHSGVDREPPLLIPEGVQFKLADLNKNSIPFCDDYFDVLVANHIIEHLDDPIGFLRECLRVCKPGGVIYIEAPSERSLLMPGMPFSYEKFCSTSFFDDPTHLGRPWSPQALYRLAAYYGCTEISAKYKISWKHRLLSPLTIPLALITRNAVLLERVIWQTFGWAAYLIARKPEVIRGAPTFRYYIPER